MKWKIFGITLFLFVNIAALLAFKLVDGDVANWVVTSALILDTLVATIWLFKIK
jgi:hypothetical protein